MFSTIRRNNSVAFALALAAALSGCDAAKKETFLSGALAKPAQAKQPDAAPVSSGEHAGKGSAMPDGNQAKLALTLPTELRSHEAASMRLTQSAASASAGAYDPGDGGYTVESPRSHLTVTSELGRISATCAGSGVARGTARIVVQELDVPGVIAVPELGSAWTAHDVESIDIPLVCDDTPVVELFGFPTDRMHQIVVELLGSDGNDLYYGVSDPFAFLAEGAVDVPVALSNVSYEAPGMSGTPGSANVTLSYPDDAPTCDASK